MSTAGTGVEIRRSSAPTGFKGHRQDAMWARRQVTCKMEWRTQTRTWRRAWMQDRNLARSGESVKPETLTAGDNPDCDRDGRCRLGDGTWRGDVTWREISIRTSIITWSGSPGVFLGCKLALFSPKKKGCLIPYTLYLLVEPHATL